MNIKNIKTKEQFNEFADIWYQRTHNLKDVWHNESEPDKKRIKAFILWNTMCKRVLGLTQIAIKLSQPLPPKTYKKGGYMAAKINKK